MLFKSARKGLVHHMENKNAREYQTVGLFAILAILTVLIVLLFKVVLFGPQSTERIRLPAVVTEPKAEISYLLGLQPVLQVSVTTQGH